jgi:hypothetical protein
MVESKSTGRCFYCLDQQDFIRDLLVKHNMHQCNGTEVPSSPDEDEGEEQEDLQKTRLAQEYVGELIWLSSRTRIDICYAVSMAASLVSSRPQSSIARCHKIWRYLRRTHNFALHARVGDDDPLDIPPEMDRGIADRLRYDREYWPQDELQLRPPDVHVRGFGDASFCAGESKSTSGLLIMMGTMPISWRSRRQPVISESSTEAELYAQSECCSLGLSAAQYLTEIGWRSRVQPDHGQQKRTCANRWRHVVAHTFIVMQSTCLASAHLSVQSVHGPHCRCCYASRWPYQGISPSAAL